MTIFYPDQCQINNRTIDNHIHKLSHKINQSHNDVLP